MSHRASLAIRPAHDGYVLGGSPEDGQVDNMPNGIYIMKNFDLSEIVNKSNIGCLHSVGVFCEDLGH
jgi:hypothetical protein